MDVRPPLVAYGQPTAAGKPSERPLHHPTVATQTLAALYAPPGDPRLYAALKQVVSAVWVVVPFVRVELRWLPAGPASLAFPRCNRVEELHEDLRVVDLGAGEHDRQRHAPASVTTCRLEPGLPLSKGFGPVSSLPFRGDAGRVEVASRPINQSRLAELVEQDAVQPPPHTCLLPVPQASPARDAAAVT